MVSVSKNGMIYSQGAACDAVFYIQKGRVKMTVVSSSGKEATVPILHPGAFFGEGGLSGQTLRVGSVTAMTDCDSCASKKEL